MFHKLYNINFNHQIFEKFIINLDDQDFKSCLFRLIFIKLFIINKISYI